MSSWISSAFSWVSSLLSIFNYFQGKKARFLILGLDNSGKTTLTGKLATGTISTYRPTNVPYTVNNIQLGDTGLTVSCTDVGGHMEVRRIWKDYCTPDTKGIIFLVDAACPSRFNEVKTELDKILADQDFEDFANIPIAILGNKIDMPSAVNDEMLKAALGLTSKTTGKSQNQNENVKNVRPLEVFMCSIVKNAGYGEAFRWIAQYC
jgi:GTP-binding protein SAR1